nr:hypothetical transcript [Hymenolepis microstoma]
MIINLVVLVLLQINAPYEIEGIGLPNSPCSRIPATPNGKTEPMVFSVVQSQHAFVYEPTNTFPIAMQNHTCMMNETSIGTSRYHDLDNDFLFVNQKFYWQ